MTNERNPSPQDPFATFKRPNPFAEAMPARPGAIEDTVAYCQTWGPYNHVETIDDGEDSRTGEHAIEVLITWGSSVLHVAHLSPPRAFVVGDESDGSGEPVDFHLPENVLGRKRLPLIAMDAGVPHLVLPDIARGTLELEKKKLDLQSVIEEAPPCPTVTRAKQHVLDGRARMKMQLGDVEFLVRLVEKSAPIEKGALSNFDSAAAGYFGMTAVTAAAFMATMAYFVPPLGLGDQSDIEKDRLLDLMHYSDQLAEKDRQREEEPAPEEGAAEDEGQEAAKADGAAGMAGKDESPHKNRRVAVKGPRDNPTLQLSRHEAIKLAENFGMIGVLNAGIAADPDAPTSVFGRDATLGMDDMSADGNLWALDIGEAAGSGGLSIMGPGPGGGFGDGLGIGIGNIGEGIGSGRGKDGKGFSRGISGGTYTAKAPNPIRTGNTIVSGRIPPQVVQRIVRQNFGRFRLCYQQGLARNPSLEGRIPVRFIIGRDGAVNSVSTVGGFPDAQVQSCVKSAFYGLSFPQPEGGTVTVTYPLIFSPS